MSPSSGAPGASGAAPVRYEVERSGRGRLAVMPAPAGDVAAVAAALAADGVTDVVCLLPEEEMGRLGLSGWPDAVQGNGLRLHRLPIGDFSTPSEEDVRALADVVTERLADDAHVVVHCRGGIGRSTTVAAVVLVTEGVRVDEAWTRLRRARRARVPETGAQARFVARVAGVPEPRQAIAMRLGEAIGLRLAAAVATRARRRRARSQGGVPGVDGSGEG